MPTDPAIESMLFRAAAPAARPSGRSARRLAAGAFGLLAGMAVYLNLPAAAFRTSAVIGTDENAPMRLAMAQAATDAIASGPVLLRASASLIATAAPVPDADLAERAALTIGLDGSHATGREARLAQTLAKSIQAAPGDIAGTVAITATDADADHAASIATAVAEAFIVDRDEHAAETRRALETAARSRLEDLKASALAARRRFVDLGGTASDPAQALAAARARTDAAQGHLDAIRSILASGSPPMSDGKDVPSTIEALQNAYLDLTHQLATARETLGDRHMTVISLQDGVRRAAASLSAEWKRLARIATADFADARARETSLREANAPSDPTRRAALDDARIAVQLADAAVTRADAAVQDIPRELAFRLIERAPSPGVPEGFSKATRLLAAAIAGLASFGLVLMAPRRKVVHAERVPKRIEGDISPDRNETRRAASLFAIEESEPAVPLGPPPVTPATRSDPFEEESRHLSIDDDADPLSRIGPIDSHSKPPTIMVAANEFAASTTAVALAIGRSAASAGLRVLLLETERARPKLAVAADPGAEPVLVSALGAVRLALPAEAGENLFIAPAFHDGTRIAATLSHDDDTPIVDQFDLIVIDRGCLEAPADPEFAADGYLRVGLVASDEDDELFLSKLGVTRDVFMGAIVQPSRLPERIERPKLAAPVAPATCDRPRPVPGTPFHASHRVVPPLTSSARRRVGVR